VKKYVDYSSTPPLSHATITFVTLTVSPYRSSETHSFNLLLISWSTSR
jgi:hypothetical protein